MTCLMFVCMCICAHKHFYVYECGTTYQTQGLTYAKLGSALPLNYISHNYIQNLYNLYNKFLDFLLIDNYF